MSSYRREPPNSLFRSLRLSLSLSSALCLFSLSHDTLPGLSSSVSFFVCFFFSVSICLQLSFSFSFFTWIIPAPLSLPQFDLSSGVVSANLSLRPSLLLLLLSLCLCLFLSLLSVSSLFGCASLCTPLAALGSRFSLASTLLPEPRNPVSQSCTHDPTGDQVVSLIMRDMSTTVILVFYQRHVKWN